MTRIANRTQPMPVYNPAEVDVTDLVIKDLDFCRRYGGDVTGLVKDGLVVPSSPLPEGAQVEIRVCQTLPEVPPELQAEFDAWDRASGEALELVERLAQEMEPDEKK